MVECICFYALDTVPYDKLKMDLMYIENYSFRMDMQIILMTIKTMLFPPKTNSEASEGLSVQESRRKEDNKFPKRRQKTNKKRTKIQEKL